VWTFDGEPPDASLPFGWGPDDMSAVHPSSQWNHTPGGSGALAVVAGTPWDAAPGIVLCGRDPDNGDSPTMDLGGRTLDAWILRDGPPTLLNGACLFVIQHPDGAFEEPRGIEFDANEIDVWRELSLTVSLATPYVWKVAIRCVMEDGWPGTLYIDDVSIR
jgi:hypothetical protein